MKIQTVIIGEYQISPAVSFCLYQLASPIVTPPRSLHQDQRQEHFINYFCLEDLFAIFDLVSCHQHLVQYYQKNPNYFCKDEAGRSYIQTHVMAEIALGNNLCALADLCRLEDDELLAGGAIPLLKMTTCVRLLAKPTVMMISFEPRRLDGSEWFFHQHPRVKLEPFSPPPSRLHRLSSISCSSMSLSDENASIKPSSLLLKRLAPKHGHKKNLTILTPSYNQDSIAHAIQSAPLKRSIVGKPNRVMKKSPIKNTRRLVLPATASAVTAPWPQTSAQARFPSPPIVPSQQPTWSRQPKPPLHPAIKTATLGCFPSTPTTSMTQKQKFLQPFEYLYDHIEQTRTLKTTLDDQIRRSSSLIQTLQSSGTMVESLVRRQVRDMMDQTFQERLRECTERIARLEYLKTKDIPISPADSPTTKKEPDLLTQLMDRIDQLESKLAEKSA